MRFASKLLQEVKESSDNGLFFKSGLLTWNKMEMLTITDASFGNESNFRSQKGLMTFSLDLIRLTKNGVGMHLIGHSSNDHRQSVCVCVGSLCKPHSDGAEESMRLRAALGDAHVVFLRTDWECHIARFMRNVWMIDCNSLNDHLHDPTLRNAATRDSASIWLRCVKWSCSLLMESCEKNRI